MITVRELIETLEKLDGDMQVIISKDEEGNCYSPLAGFSINIYVPDTAYLGDIYLLELTDELREKGYDEEDIYYGDDGERAVVLWPLVWGGEMSEEKIAYTVLENKPAITPLESAMRKLGNDNSKVIHLSPREAEAVVAHTKTMLETIRYLDDLVNEYRGQQADGGQDTRLTLGLSDHWYDTNV